MNMENQSHTQTPFEKIEKGSGNMVIQCLAPRGLQSQHTNQIAQFSYVMLITM